MLYNVAMHCTRDNQLSGYVPQRKWTMLRIRFLTGCQTLHDSFVMASMRKHQFTFIFLHTSHDPMFTRTYSICSYASTRLLHLLESLRGSGFDRIEYIIM